MIESGKKVKLDYVLKVEGEVVDSSEKSGPFEYEHGNGQIIRGLESKLEGLAAGEEKDITVGPDDGYGPVDPKAVIDIPKENMPEGDVQVGAMIQGQSPNGQTYRGVIEDVGEEKVKVNFNHPLAGKELHFEVKVLDVA